MHALSNSNLISHHINYGNGYMVQMPPILPSGAMPHVGVALKKNNTVSASPQKSQIMPTAAIDPMSRNPMRVDMAPTGRQTFVTAHLIRKAQQNQRPLVNHSGLDAAQHRRTASHQAQPSAMDQHDAAIANNVIKHKK